MSTGIYRQGIIGREEVEQGHIDFWCELCQFPLIGGKQGCKGDKSAIQQCWDGANAVGGEWHKQHECPFIHLSQPCRCNDFEDIKEAFKAAGLNYS